MMGNHGVLVIANTVGEAFDDICALERAARSWSRPMQREQPLNILPDGRRKHRGFAQDWGQITDFSIAHFEEMKCILDAEDPSYAH